jgi:hypothetical protein
MRKIITLLILLIISFGSLYAQQKLDYEDYDSDKSSVFEKPVAVYAGLSMSFLGIAAPEVGVKVGDVDIQAVVSFPFWVIGDPNQSTQTVFESEGINYIAPRFDVDYNLTGFNSGFNFLTGISYLGIFKTQKGYNANAFAINFKFESITSRGFEFGVTTFLPFLFNYKVESETGPETKTMFIYSNYLSHLSLVLGGLCCTSFDFKFNF